MAETSPLNLTNNGADFTTDESKDPNAPAVPARGNNTSESLDDDDNNAVKTKNDRNQNSTNSSSQSAKANTYSTADSLSLLNSSVYFNYRGVNNQNFSDPNFIADSHITTVDSLIQFFSKYPSLKLKYTHFVYLKKIGVYPNNRLIIARRYASPAPDDMFNASGTSLFPIATVVSWMDPNESLLELSFNEVWEDATETLMDIFQNILSSTGAPEVPPLPLPGFSKPLQYAISEALGLTNTGVDNIPQGNPDLIHETKRRRVPGDDLGGSGLQSDFKITMKCEYEQKYIGNIDPTIGYLDVIGNLLMMGTSTEQFLLTGAASGTLQELFDLAKQNEWKNFAMLIIDTLVTKIDGILGNLGILTTGTGSNTESESGSYDDNFTDNGGGGSVGISDGFKSGLNALGGLKDVLLEGVFAMYREKLQASISAMSGLPNGPWHIMMGNPKDPFFVSGDMICSKITIDFLPELAYNDLPLYYNATLEFIPARNHGMEGLGSKLNHGKGRIYGSPPKDFSGANGSPGKSRSNTQTSQKTANKTK